MVGLLGVGIGVALLAAPPRPSDLAVCEARSEALLGTRAVRAGRTETVSGPTLRRRVAIVWPDPRPAGCRGTQTLHDLLIDRSGAVVGVFTLRSPCDSFDRAVRTSLRQWTFEPARTSERTVPACLVVRTLVDPR